MDADKLMRIKQICFDSSKSRQDQRLRDLRRSQMLIPSRTCFPSNDHTKMPKSPTERIRCSLEKIRQRSSSKGASRMISRLPAHVLKQAGAYRALRKSFNSSELNRPRKMDYKKNAEMSPSFIEFERDSDEDYK